MTRSFIAKYSYLSIALIFFLLLPLVSATAERPFPRPRGPVNDFANVIPQAYEQKMDAVSRELLQKTGTALVVVTMPDIGGAEYNDYANRLYRAWGIGKKGEDKGVLIFVTVKERCALRPVMGLRAYCPTAWRVKSGTIIWYPFSSRTSSVRGCSMGP
jgi:uncharacterized membrane protein YgcG